MASIFCAISFIKNITNLNKYVAGTAIYRTENDDFIEYKFKAFQTEFTPLITINQYIVLNIATLGDEPTAYNLPIALTFGIFIAPVQDPAITKNNQEIFRSKREVYNSVTRKQSPLLVLYPNAQSNYANKRKRQEELEQIAEKFNSHSTSTYNLYRNSSQKPLYNPFTKSIQSNTTPNQTRIDQL
ncbi:28182_t:CDS:2, partial [Gigaspora margarita]